MQVLKQNKGSHVIYKLKDDESDEVLGEAVTSECENAVRLHGIFVKPEHRRRGCGTTLMETVLSLGEAKSITLCTGLGNVGFFERFGFEVTELGDTLVSMEKQL